MGSRLRELGSGLGYRAELAGVVGEHAGRIDWLEVITEHYLFAPADLREELGELAGRFPVVPHGVEMSIGSAGEVDGVYLDALAALVDEIDAPWFSDHLCFTRTEDVLLGLLAPLPRTRDVARELGRKARRVQDAVGRPFLLENITYYVDLATPLTEAQFIAEVMEHCDCHLLLDLANLDINARNHGFDPLGFLDVIPVERVAQVHLAGGIDGVAGEMSLDSHGAAVPERVWELLDELLSRTAVPATLIERDQNFPDDPAELLADLDRARARLRRPLARDGVADGRA
ncbi:UPF0276 protein [Microtetraspora sp. NBRC 13810]|uniref:DUF692 domain-containing protein n=1 Tax=Microtetraspora sp. NBRC 13810 TaxID=3030990 RepID=UPI0024A4C737|nr:DUF692 domain-containing protein [Microtetraspora sp. NBRC 13810]GLW10383.1 UPF0276 protein [Microtetraspora sp. NBRC 13810]